MEEQVSEKKVYFTVEELINILKPIFEDENIAKISHNAKFLMHLLKNHNCELNSIIFDTMLADYIKDSSFKHGLKQQALSYLQYDMQDASELLGKGKMMKTVCELPLHDVFDYFTNDAFAILKLAKYHIENLTEKEINLFYEIELPLTKVLFEMERNGVSIDTKYLKEFSDNIDIQIKDLEKNIFEIAGCEFNINSPKQVGEVLFEKLGLKSKGKNKTKTGYSTSAEVLEELAVEYEIAKLILEHRHLNKIKSTYIDVLPELVSTKDKRVHTTFNQTITTTGRLSSSNPNLQNIPARTEIGNNIRKAFIPENENSVILAADYSQIELRLLAHYSDDPILTSAFINNEDIHATTAAKIFNVKQEEVTKDMRRKAKAVNFGIIYGQTRYGLSEALSITPQEAQEFIDKYFETYPKIKEYMETTKLFAIQNGYVETLYGRKRYFGNELNSSNKNIREFAQRAAINAPLQGTAADLIKIAMINLNKGLNDKFKSAKMILQVHDELIIEVPNDIVKDVAELTIKSMELSQPLNVPLVVDLNYGKNWKEAK
ncbi:MAG: DNA polymerase I [Candidatus Gastranaerophilales bacterium]|nr:DNA polymerase I [Candidatus Gastranaerophilales bacterium]